MGIYKPEGANGDAIDAQAVGNVGVGVSRSAWRVSFECLLGCWLIRGVIVCGICL